MVLGLLSLPNELIAQISDQLETCKEFRKTCKRINLIVSHRLLSHIVIDINKRRISLSISQLEALAGRLTRAAEHIHTVDIRDVAPNYYPIIRSYTLLQDGLTIRRIEQQNSDVDMDWAEKKIRELLPVALSTLVGAQTVVWAINDRDPAWASSIISKFLATLPLLRTLHLISPWIDEYKFYETRISNLTKLTVRGCLDISVSEIIGSSPDLIHLDVEYVSHHGSVGSTSMFHELLGRVPHDNPLKLHHLRIHHCHVRLDHKTIPHLRMLQSLDLNIPNTLMGSDLSSSPLAEVWGVIRREALPVKAIITPINNAVLDHLAGITGIQKLDLIRASCDWAASTGTPIAESQVLAHKFFTQVLPLHRQTLVSLNISPGFGIHWCLGPRNLDSIIECTHLVELSVVMDFTSWDGVQERTSDNVVEEVLHMAAQLPNLTWLEFSKSKVSVRHPQRWSPRIKVEAIFKSITSFGPVNLDIHPLLVKHQGKEFQPCLGSDGTVRYVPRPPSRRFPRLR
ncbi:hypothetical protein BD779DRAFT_1530819 [Infundibulicybe gibba]|nr:hypothetical protein BD779DRAFT_1530819 [Infundibulicybe gibba]